MPEDSNPLSGLWPLAPSGATDWLLETCGDGLTGFMPPAMPDAAWVLNAMYEHERGPTETSYHEYHQARLTEGSVQPCIIGGIDLEAVGVATGGGLGRAEHPGPPAYASSNRSASDDARERAPPAASPIPLDDRLTEHCASRGLVYTSGPTLDVIAVSGHPARR
jgi:hypothetical protein